MKIRDKFVTGTFSINHKGEKEPTDWKSYAENLEKYIESQQPKVDLKLQLLQAAELLNKNDIIGDCDYTGYVIKIKEKHHLQKKGEKE